MTVTHFWVGYNIKSPPQVETEVSHTGFPIWPIKRPCDGFFMLDRTSLPCLAFLLGLGYF